MGRPHAEINVDKLKMLMRLAPSLEDTAAYLDVNRRTIERFIRKNYSMTFMEFKEHHMAHTRLTLVQKAIQMAEKGDKTMLIFSLKNLCGWKDRDDNQRIFIDGKEYTVDQIVSELASQLSKSKALNVA